MQVIKILTLLFAIVLATTLAPFALAAPAAVDLRARSPSSPHSSLHPSSRPLHKRELANFFSGMFSKVGGYFSRGREANLARDPEQVGKDLWGKVLDRKVRWMNMSPSEREALQQYSNKQNEFTMLLQPTFEFKPLQPLEDLRQARERLRFEQNNPIRWYHKLNPFWTPPKQPYKGVGNLQQYIQNNQPFVLGEYIKLHQEAKFLQTPPSNLLARPAQVLRKRDLAPALRKRELGNFSSYFSNFFSKVGSYFGRGKAVNPYDAKYLDPNRFDQEGRAMWGQVIDNKITFQSMNPSQRQAFAQYADQRRVNPVGEISRFKYNRMDGVDDVRKAREKMLFEQRNPIPWYRKFNPFWKAPRAPYKGMAYWTRYLDKVEPDAMTLYLIRNAKADPSIKLNPMLEQYRQTAVLHKRDLGTFFSGLFSKAEQVFNRKPVIHIDNPFFLDQKKYDQVGRGLWEDIKADRIHWISLREWQREALERYAQQRKAEALRQYTEENTPIEEQFRSRARYNILPLGDVRDAFKNMIYEANHPIRWYHKYLPSIARPPPPKGAEYWLNYIKEEEPIALHEFVTTNRANNHPPPAPNTSNW